MPYRPGFSMQENNGDLFENVKILTNGTQCEGRLFENQCVLPIPTSYLPCPPHAPQQRKKTGAEQQKAMTQGSSTSCLCPWTSQVSGFSPADWASKLTLQRLMWRLDEITVDCSIDVSPTLLSTKRVWVGNMDFKRPLYCVSFTGTLPFSIVVTTVLQAESRSVNVFSWLTQFFCLFLGF